MDVTSTDAIAARLRDDAKPEWVGIISSAAVAADVNLILDEREAMKAALPILEYVSRGRDMSAWSPTPTFWPD